MHNENNQRALAYVKEMDYNNLKLREIAEKLNSNGFKTSTSKAFTTTHVIRLKNKINDGISIEALYK